MAKNTDLQKANKAKKDEFYTQLTDIEKELWHYKEHFKNKTVFCNCDDPYESNFFKYFAMNFNFLGLKKLIATCYDGSPIAGEELPLYEIETAFKLKKPYKIEITEVTDENGDGAVDLADVELLIKNHKNTLAVLDGNGDFRSAECIELLKQADIVVTNPPFSLFREYVAQLIQYDKKFLIIGNVNSITYKEIFPLIQENRLWLGASIHSGDREFAVPDSYPLNAASSRVDKNGKKYIRVKGVRWFTNLDYPQRHEELVLYKRYTPDEYPKYDNYDAINVNKTTDIPYDYVADRNDEHIPDSLDMIQSRNGNNDMTRSTVQYSTVQYSTVQCSTVQYSTVQYSTVQYSTVQYSTVQVNHSQTENATALWESRLHSSTNIIPNSLKSSVMSTRSISKTEEDISRENGCTAEFSSGVKRNGIMGVPITFLDKYNPEQFEIIGLDRYVEDNPHYGHRFTINGKETYARILIRRKGK